MYDYQTELTKVCRIIANKTRLNILWLLFDSDLYVEELAVQSEISPQHASKLLSSMAAKKLITPERRNRHVFYRPHHHGPKKQLLAALKAEKHHKTPHDVIIHHATAFTHDRRIQLARTLAASPRTFDELLTQTGMTGSAQTRHLRKLLHRHVLSKTNGVYRLQNPSSPLAKHLLSIAVR